MTLRQGKRLSVCQTITESAPSGRVTSGREGSTIRTLPSVAASSPPMIWTRVLLPQPLGPSRHENRRDANLCEKFSSAMTGSSPRPGQACVTFSTDTSIARGTGVLLSPRRLQPTTQSCRIQSPLADPFRIPDYARTVLEMRECAVTINNPAIDHHHARIAAFAGANEGRNRPVKHADIG